MSLILLSLHVTSETTSRQASLPCVVRYNAWNNDFGCSICYGATILVFGEFAGSRFLRKFSSSGAMTSSSAPFGIGVLRLVVGSDVTSYHSPTHIRVTEKSGHPSKKHFFEGEILRLNRGTTCAVLKIIVNFQTIWEVRKYINFFGSKSSKSFRVSKIFRSIKVQKKSVFFSTGPDSGSGLLNDLTWPGTVVVNFSASNRTGPACSLVEQYLQFWCHTFEIGWYVVRTNP